jgi:hypothetical protein
MDFDFGQFWMKGQNSNRAGKCQIYNRQLSTLISAGKARPSLIVSHELSLDRLQMPTSISMPAIRDGRKVLLKPEMINKNKCMEDFTCFVSCLVR